MASLKPENLAFPAAVRAVRAPKEHPARAVRDLALKEAPTEPVALFQAREAKDRRDPLVARDQAAQMQALKEALKEEKDPERDPERDPLEEKDPEKDRLEEVRVPLTLQEAPTEALPQEREHQERETVVVPLKPQTMVVLRTLEVTCPTNTIMVMAAAAREISSTNTTIPTLSKKTTLLVPKQMIWETTPLKQVPMMVR